MSCQGREFDPVEHLPQQRHVDEGRGVVAEGGNLAEIDGVAGAGERPVNDVAALAGPPGFDALAEVPKECTQGIARAGRVGGAKRKGFIDRARGNGLGQGG